MRKTHLISNQKIRIQLDYGYLPTQNFIEYLLNNVEDFKNIKLNKSIENTCLLDLNIIDAKFSGYIFEYEIA